MSRNGDTPATKADLANLKQQLQEATKVDLANLKQELVEAIHDSETRLLTAFYGWAEATQKHLADLDQNDSAMRQRLASLEGRLLAVEKRLDIPPAS